MAHRNLSSRTADRLKDEVYRQMFRLEAERPAADLLLALALLRAWVVLEEQPPDCEPRQWLRKICPMCLRMIETLRGPGACNPPGPQAGNPMQKGKPDA